MSKFSKPHMMNPEILRAYDIRGVYGKTITDQDAWSIGIAFGHYILQHGGRSVAVARDGRLSSPSLAHALIQGLIESGVDVQDLGIGPTPLLYFGVETLEVRGGIMITGSHNPPDHNGFKFCLKEGPFYGENIQKLPILLKQAFENPIDPGAVHTVDLMDAYVTRLTQDLNPPLIKAAKMSIVWDSGNGATGEVVQKLAEHIPAEHHFLNIKIDGTFPSHHPDPSDPETLTQLVQAVQDLGATIGIAFDGDGDRLGAVDHQGCIINSEELMQIFLEDILENNPGAKILYDVKTTNAVRDKIKALGGTPIMWKTGHATIKAEMAKIDAVFGGEVSGHTFFRDKYYGYDDGIYGAMRLLDIISKNPTWLAFKDLPSHYFQTPEIVIPCSHDQKFDIIKSVAERLTQENIPFNDLDGVRVENDQGWWLLRASNTQDHIMMRAESTSVEGLEKLKEEMKNYLRGLVELPVFF